MRRYENPLRSIPLANGEEEGQILTCDDIRVQYRVGWMLKPLVLAHIPSAGVCVSELISELRSIKDKNWHIKTT